MISRNGDSVRLHCTIPTWCPASDTCKNVFFTKDSVLVDKFGRWRSTWPARSPRSFLGIHSQLIRVTSCIRGEFGNTVITHRCTNCFQILASYALAPSSSPLCLVCALHPDLSASEAKSAAIKVFQNAKYGRDNVLLGELEHGPALIITWL